MFNWKEEKKAQNAIYLDKEMGGKGRQFKSRFLVPGLVKYDYGVCLLTKENADKFIQDFVGCPVIINHQDVTDENAKEISVGNIFSVWFDEKDGYYWCNGIITDKHAIELIEKGYSVSCQYTITEYSDNNSGALHNGNPYDKIIEDGRPEHLAIVNNPRYEGAIIAVNAIMAQNEDRWITVHPHGEDEKGRHLLLKDGETPKEAMQRQWGAYEKRQASKEWEDKYKGSKQQRELYNTKINELSIALLNNDKKKSEYLKGITSILKERRDENYINKQKEIFENIKKQDKDLYNEPLIQGQVEALKKLEEFIKSEQKQSDTKEEKYEVPKDYKDSLKKYSKEMHEHAADFYGEKMVKAAKKANAGIGKDDGGEQYKTYSAQFEEYKALKEYHEAQIDKENQDKAQNSFINEFKDTLYTALAEGIANRLGELIARNKNPKEKWVTIKGNHILLKEGESIADAFKRTTGVSLQKENKYQEKKETHKPSKEYTETLARVKEGNNKNITPENIISRAIKNLGIDADKLKNKIEEAESYKDGILETNKRYSDGNGVYKRERAEYHKEIIKDIFKNAKSARPKEGEKPTFMILGGRGGSGKSKFDGLVYDKDKYIVLDADAIKELLPEYKGYNAFEVHEESSDILKQALKKAQKEGLNVVLDGTMKSLNSTERKIKDFADKGYNIEMYYMHLPREKAAERAIGRFMGKNGRYVPLEVLLDMKNNEENFDQLKKYASKWAFYNNDVATKEDDPILVDKNY